MPAITFVTDTFVINTSKYLEVEGFLCYSSFFSPLELTTTVYSKTSITQTATALLNICLPIHSSMTII